MSLLVFLLLARPGGDTGGAEASPPRLRARGAAPEPTCWHRHGATPGAGRGVEKTQGEASGQLHNEHSDAKKLSGDEQRRRGLGDRADSAARGAQAPLPPTAAAAWLARTALTFSARMAKLSSQCRIFFTPTRHRRRGRYCAPSPRQRRRAAQPTPQPPSAAAGSARRRGPTGRHFQIPSSKRRCRR